MLLSLNVYGSQCEGDRKLRNHMWCLVLHVIKCGTDLGLILRYCISFSIVTLYKLESSICKQIIMMYFSFILVLSAFW